VLSYEAEAMLATQYYVVLIRVVMLAGVGDGLLPQRLFDKIEQPCNQNITILYTEQSKNKQSGYGHITPSDIGGFSEIIHY